jgi:RimJ/RimL family protein N-acetyltransferase
VSATCSKVTKTLPHAESRRETNLRQERSIETERLVLHVHRVEDFEDMYAMWSDPVVTRHIGGKPFSREEVWARLLRYAGSWSLLGYGFWVVRDKESGGFIGEVGFHNLRRNIEPSFGDRPELGFALAPRSHGKGFATEAARAALDWSDLRWGEGETVCMIAPENASSLQIARKLGYAETAYAEYGGSPVIIFTRRGVARMC